MKLYVSNFKILNVAKYTTNLIDFNNTTLFQLLPIAENKIKLNKQQYTSQRIHKRSKIFKKNVFSVLTCMQYVQKKDWGEFQSKKRLPFRKKWVFQL